jgi:hypothetical protein
MAMQAQNRPVGSVFLQPEDSLALGLQQLGRHRLGDRAVGREGRIERQPLVRPLMAARPIRSATWAAILGS